MGIGAQTMPLNLCPTNGNLFDVAWPNEQFVERTADVQKIFYKIIETYDGYVGLSDRILRDIVVWEKYVEYSFGSLWTAENSPINFLVLVLWNVNASEEYPVVNGAEHVGFAYRRLLAHSISSPLVSIRDQVVKISIYHLLHTVCCSEARTLTLGCWKHYSIRIPVLFQQVNVYTFESAQCLETRSTETRPPTRRDYGNAEITGAQARPTGGADAQRPCPKGGPFQP